MLMKDRQRCIKFRSKFICGNTNSQEQNRLVFLASFQFFFKSRFVTTRFNVTPMINTCNTIAEHTDPTC